MLAFEPKGHSVVGVAENGTRLFRTASGWREWSRLEPPTQAEMELGKAKLLEWPAESWCPCCDTTFSGDNIMAYESIEAHGVCESCYGLSQGWLRGVRVRRQPTLNEALAVSASDLGYAESVVIREKLIELLALTSSNQ